MYHYTLYKLRLVQKLKTHKTFESVKYNERIPENISVFYIYTTVVRVAKCLGY